MDILKMNEREMKYTISKKEKRKHPVDAPHCFFKNCSVSVAARTKEQKQSSVSPNLCCRLGTSPTHPFFPSFL